MRFDTRTPPRLLSILATPVYRAAMAFSRARRMVYGVATVGKFASRGDGFVFDPDGTYTYSTIHVGNNVDLGLRPTIIAAIGKVRIGNNVMFGPEVTIRGGNHRIDVVGTPMIAVVKEPGDNRFDRGVVIEDDVWIGTRATILHGVTIGRGAVIGAGSVVTKSIPPYAIAAGVPAKVIRLRWSIDVIADHERTLYPPNERLSHIQLSELAHSSAANRNINQAPEFCRTEQLAEVVDRL